PARRDRLAVPGRLDPPGPVRHGARRVRPRPATQPDARANPVRLPRRGAATGQPVRPRGPADRAGRPLPPGARGRGRTDPGERRPGPLALVAVRSVRALAVRGPPQRRTAGPGAL